MVGVSLLVLLSVVAGCSLIPPRGHSEHSGQSEDEAELQLRSIPGIEDARVAAFGVYSGLTWEAFAGVTVTISPGFSVSRMPDFVEFLAQVAWSVNAEQPNTRVRMGIAGTPAPVLEAALRSAGWEIRPGQQGTDLYVPVKVVRGKLGPWPGPVPKVPDRMIVPEPAQETDSDSAALDLAPRAAPTVE
jgi:hypothetical protein